MRLSTTSLIAIALATSVVNSAPTVANTGSDVVSKRDADAELMDILNNLEEYKSKRDEVYDHLDKREYQIVTDVLKALNNTQISEKIIKYLATNEKIEPYTVKTIVAVLKSGKLNMTALFEALDESNLVTKVVQDLIGDCSLYVSLFRTAESKIDDLVEKVQEKISSLTSKRDLLEQPARAASTPQLEARLDLETISVNLLESLGNSGLATSVVKAIITDKDYIPFGKDLITQVLASDALSLTDLIDALKNTSLASNLLDSILSASTFNTVIENAFAAYSGECSGTSTSSSSDSSSSGSSDDSSSSGSSGSSSSSSTTVDPCKRRRRRRRRATYNY